MWIFEIIAFRFINIAITANVLILIKFFNQFFSDITNKMNINSLLLWVRVTLSKKMCCMFSFQVFKYCLKYLFTFSRSLFVFPVWIWVLTLKQKSTANRSCIIDSSYNNMQLYDKYLCAEELKFSKLVILLWFYISSDFPIGQTKSSIIVI